MHRYIREYGLERADRVPREHVVVFDEAQRAWDEGKIAEFYTKKLGMEVRADVTLPEMGGFRWLTVGPADQPDIAIVLMPVPDPPMIDAETGAKVRELMAKGVAGTIFLTTDDCQASYEELQQAYSAAGAMMYQAQQASAGAADAGFTGGATGGAGFADDATARATANAEPDVVEADYEIVDDDK